MKISKQTIYTLYRFKGIDNLVFADNHKWYLADSLVEKQVKYKNGRNGLYINRQFISLKKLRKFAYRHTELLKKQTDFCPF